MKNLVAHLLISVLVATCLGQNGKTFQDINTNRGSNTNGPVFNNSDLEFNKSGNQNESYAIIRSTLGVSGTAVTLTSGDQIYFIDQSIGQESVIGTFNNDEYILRQGYQQPNIKSQIVPIPLESELKATIYPNPFKQSVNISFEELITGNIQISIVNIMGKSYLTQEFPGSQIINLPLQHFPKGIYVVKVNAINKQFTARITKQ